MTTTIAGTWAYGVLRFFVTWLNQPTLIEVAADIEVTTEADART